MFSGIIPHSLCVSWYIIASIVSLCVSKILISGFVDHDFVFHMHPGASDFNSAFEPLYLTFLCLGTRMPSPQS